MLSAGARGIGRPTGLTRSAAGKDHGHLFGRDSLRHLMRRLRRCATFWL